MAKGAITSSKLTCRKNQLGLSHQEEFDGINYPPIDETIKSRSVAMSTCVAYQ